MGDVQRTIGVGDESDMPFAAGLARALVDLGIHDGRDVADQRQGGRVPIGSVGSDRVDRLDAGPAHAVADAGHGGRPGVIARCGTARGDLGP